MARKFVQSNPKKRYIFFLMDESKLAKMIHSETLARLGYSKKKILKFFFLVFFLSISKIYTRKKNRKKNFCWRFKQFKKIQKNFRKIFWKKIQKKNFSKNFRFFLNCLKRLDFFQCKFSKYSEIKILKLIPKFEFEKLI